VAAAQPVLGLRQVIEDLQLHRPELGVGEGAGENVGARVLLHHVGHEAQVQALGPRQPGVLEPLEGVKPGALQRDIVVEQVRARTCSRSCKPTSPKVALTKGAAPVF
jgi:hypothetical protein